MEGEAKSLFEGFVKKVKFSNNDGFYILEVQNKEKENNILQGYAQNIRQGDYFKSEGNWIHKKGNILFNSDIIEILEPTEEETILEYLSSGIIKGIGKGTATKIVEYFGTESLKILDEKPEKLLRIPKLGQRTLTKILNSWKEVKPSEQVVSELIRLGFKHFEAVKIYKKFNGDSLQVLKTYPYNICYKIKSIDFKTVDYIVLNMGFPEDSPIRIKAAIRFFLYEIQKTGDCIINKNDVLKLTSNFLKKIPKDVIESSLEEGIKKGQFHRIVKNNIEYIQTESMFNFEMELAKRLYLLNNHDSKKNIIPVDTINYVEKKIKYSEEQENAIKTSLSNKVSIITGKPGVGKTTVLKEIISQFELLDKNILLCAPTGKAAQKMTESTGMESATIHRLLEFNPIKDGFSIDENNPLKLNVIIIDEASMIDIFLMVHLLRAIPNEAQIVVIGDIGQLPSVSEGAVLRDIIYSKMFAVARIEKIQRQKGTSSIVLNAHSIDKGEFNYNPVYNSNELEDFYFLHTQSDSETLLKMENIIKNKINKSFNFCHKKDIQVLAPTHKGDLGTENLNKKLQSILNNEEEDNFAIKKGNFHYKKDDKVIQIVNNYDKLIFNGDTGTIKVINEKGIFIEFDNGKSCEYTIKEMEELLPSYVITGHKSQGSEYPVVIIPLPQVFTQVIDRSWIYTAITRGKSLVIVLGNKDVMKRGILSEKSRNRNTDLKDKIIEVFNYF